MMSPSSLDETRRHYLATLLASHGTLHLPIRSTEHTFPFQSIYQPLTLRPFSFETTPQEEAIMTARTGAEALAQSALQRMIVLGGPGMGKTTLLKALLQQAIHAAQADPTAALPLFISLPDLARSGLTLSSYLPGILSQLRVDARYVEILQDAVHAGQAFLCLDSLDEVVPAQRPDMIALINREAIRCGGMWIIGSRFTEYQGGQFVHSQFAEWELQPLDDPLRLEMACHLLPLLSDLLQRTPAPTAQGFLEALKNDTRIAAWGENPLLLSLTALVYVQAGMLPGSRAALYRDIISILLTIRTPDPHEQAELRTLLAEVALQLYQTKGRNFSVAELFEILNTLVPHRSFQEQVVLVERLLSCGLLDVVSEQTYGFQHQMFQEYLAAVALADQLCGQNPTEQHAAWEFLWRKHTYSRWSEVLRLCVGVVVQEYGEQGSQIAARWLHRLAEEQQSAAGDVGHLCLELAVGSLREFPLTLSQRELVQTTRELILLWAQILIKTSSVYSRLGRLTEDVRMLDCHLILPAIIWLEEVQNNELLESSNARSSVESLLSRLFVTAPTRASWLPVTVPARVLERAFPDSQGISLTASMLPGTLRRLASLENLVLLLQDTQEHWRIRASAAQLLAAWGERTPLSVLSAIAVDSACPYQVRVAAVEALEKQEERIPIDLLVALLRDPDERIRLSAVRALAFSGDCLPVEPFLAALNDHDQKVQDAVEESAKLLAGQMASEPLLYALSYGHEKMRRVAVTLLGRNAPRDLLLVALHDPDKDVRGAAITLLGRDIPRDLLLAALYDPHNDVRSAAITVLGKDTPWDLLLAALHDPHNDVRGAAIDVAGELGGSVPLESLLGILYEEGNLTFDSIHRNSLCNKAILALRQSGRTVPGVTLLALAQEYHMLKHRGVLKCTFAIARLLDIALPIETLLAGLSELEGHWDLNDVTYLLARLGEHAPLEALLAMVCHPLTSENQTRLAATNVLLQLASFVPTEPIFAALQEVDTTSKLYEALVCLLIRCGAPVKSEFLLNALKGKGRDESDILMNALIQLGEQAPLEDLLGIWSDRTMERYNRDRWPQWVAEKILKCVYGAIAVKDMQTVSSHSIEDEHVALSILGIMGNSASLDCIKSIMDDECRDHGLRKEARYLLNDAGVVLLPHDFVAEEDLSLLLRALLGVRDFNEVASIHERELQPLIQELLAFLSAHRYYGFDDKMEREVAHELAPSLSLEAVVVLLDHSHPWIRRLATYILAAFAERAPINKLIAMLQNPEEDRMVRVALIEALGELYAYTPVEVLMAHLHDTDQRVREAALVSLRRWGKNIPLEPLLALVNDMGYSLRGEAIRALGWLQERAPLDLLLALLKSESKDDATNALVALSSLEKDVPQDIVIPHLFRHEFAEVRSTVLEELAMRAEDLPLTWLLPALDVENDDENDLDIYINNDMRSNIIARLGDFAEAAPEQFVALAQDDVRPPVRVALMKALAKLGQDAPSELVLAALEDPQTEVRKQARLALLELNIDPALIPLEPLLAALQEMRYSDRDGSNENDEHPYDDEDAHKTELALLAKCGARVPVAPLLASLGNFNPYVCVQAASALFQTHPEVFGEVVQQAEAILRGEPTAGFFASRVQSRMARRVYRMECATPEVLALISNLLDWPYWPVRRDAASALGSIHRNIPDQAIRRLLELRHDPESQAVREAADKALTEILSRESGMEDE